MPLPKIIEIPIGDSGALQYHYVAKHISSAEILTLNSVPVELVAAPGAGKALIMVKAMASLSYGTLAYATNTTLQFENDSGDDQGSLAGVLNNGSDIMKLWLDHSSEIKENEALNLSVVGGDPTAGDGTLDIYLWYINLVL